MTVITDFFKKYPLVVAGLLFVIGVIGGLTWAWMIYPVEWTDSDIAHLSAANKQQYVQLVADYYALNPNVDVAKARVMQLGPEPLTVISKTQSAAKGDEAIRVSQLQILMDAALPTAETKPAAPSLFDTLRLPLLAAVLVVAFLVIAGLIYWRVSTGGAGKAAGAAGTPRAVRPLPGRAQPAAPAAPLEGVVGETQPVARFMTTYTLGDDSYDDSFSIDGPDGNFLGECGTGISETVGVGDPKKVTAFEVWLFDKNDIRTVTRVVMSEHAYRDEALRSKLAAKGEPMLAKSGDTVSLETATLIVTARIVDMAYGGGALPPNSFFERVTIELAAYRKAEAATAPAPAVAA